MSEKKKMAVEALKCCILRDPDDRFWCSTCPYRDPNINCLNRLKMDVLELLLEGEDASCGPDYCEIEE